MAAALADFEAAAARLKDAQAADVKFCAASRQCGLFADPAGAAACASAAEVVGKAKGEAERLNNLVYHVKAAEAPTPLPAGKSLTKVVEWAMVPPGAFDPRWSKAAVEFDVSKAPVVQGGPIVGTSYKCCSVS